MQVVAKLKSRHMAGTFTKNKKCKTKLHTGNKSSLQLPTALHNIYIDEPCSVSGIISGVNCDVAAWPGRERESDNEQRAYFGIVTTDRTIEFECSGKGEKQMWIEGIQYMMNFRAYMK